MKRFALALLLLGLLVLAGAVSSKPDHRVRLKGKVAVCHFPEQTPDSLGVVEPPHVIIIAAPAVRAHLENHGDCLLAASDTLRAGAPCDCGTTVPQF